MEAGEEALSSPTETEFPLRRPSKLASRRTVLAGKGPLRRADARPCPLRAVRLVTLRDRRLRRKLETVFVLTKERPLMEA